VHTLYRDVLGLYQVDTVNKKVQLRFSDVSMPKCEGTIPVPEGLIKLAWHIEGDQVKYHLELPAGYEAKVESKETATAY